MVAPQHRIFISHSHLDNEFGTRLAQDLRHALNDESAVWYDVLGGLHGGENWWEKIVQELSARNVFLLVLSPDALNSIWVRREISMAINENEYILPVLHRQCDIRPDLKILQIISFLAPKAYDAALQEVLVALGLPTQVVSEPKRSVIPQANPATTTLLEQMEEAFAEQDWPNVIRKASYLIKQMPTQVSATVYRLQAIALAEEGESQQAQEAFELGLALVSNRAQRLTLLSDYSGLLARENQWANVLKCSKEALRLVPNDPAWLAIQQQAQSRLAPKQPVQPILEQPVKSQSQGGGAAPKQSQSQGGAISSPPRFSPTRAKDFVLLRTLTGHTNGVLSVALNADGLLLASGNGDSDRTVRIWNPRTGQLLRSLTGHKGNIWGVAFSPDRQTLASADPDIRIWSVQTDQHLRTLINPNGSARVAYSPDGQTLASASYDRTIMIWGTKG